MAWTPPSKFIVVLTFLLWIFGLFILFDLSGIIWSPQLLPSFSLFTFSPNQTWMLIAIIIFFFTWFLFFLAIKVRGI
ncbi:MAG: hypothetical protein ACFFBH_01470 [Promethearchaeota archaeon]